MADRSNPGNGYGFKIPDRSNLLEPDPLSKVFSTIDEYGSRPFSSDDIFCALEPIRLTAPVPHEVRRAFQMALGSLPYAYWYYPLYTIGAQQLLRVADFALDQFARNVGLERSYSLGERIQRLSATGALADDNLRRWQLIRRLRNSATHPGFQEVWGLPQARDVAQSVAEAIGALPWTGGPDTE
jgi:hypothetical protein